MSSPSFHLFIMLCNKKNKFSPSISKINDQNLRWAARLKIRILRQIQFSKFVKFIILYQFLKELFVSSPTCRVNNLLTTYIPSNYQPLRPQVPDFSQSRTAQCSFFSTRSKRLLPSCTHTRWPGETGFGFRVLGFVAAPPHGLKVHPVPFRYVFL